MFLETISTSKSDVIDQCLLKYDYRYIRRYPGYPSKNEDALDFGTYMHRIFELGYKCNHIKELEAISENIKSEYKVPLVYKDRIHECLSNFFRLNSGLGETVDVEHEFNLELAQGIKFNGFIDRIVKGKDGGYLVIDYKTSKKQKTKMDLLRDKQLTGYAYAVATEFNVPVNKIWCAHYYPITDTLVSVQFTQAAINRWKDKEISKVWNIRKKKKNEFPPMVNQFCDWCEYKDMCPAHCDAELVKTRLEEQEKLKEEKLAQKSALPIING